MYYFPYTLYFVNFLSFTHHNNINDSDMSNTSDKKTDLWSISRWSYTKYKGNKTFTASYNHLTQNYEFDGKRYISYDDVITDALKI